MSDQPKFLPGLALARSLYEAVAPILAERFPDLPYSAARIGPGSEVLGFDTPRSADHDWGPRLTLFVRAEDADRHGEALRAALSTLLPKTVRGWPTNFRRFEESDPVSIPAFTDGPVDHRIEITDLGSWLSAALGTDSALRGELTLLDWLSMPQQRLAETVGGAVFHDGLQRLRPVRAPVLVSRIGVAVPARLPVDEAVPRGAVHGPHRRGRR